MAQRGRKKNIFTSDDIASEYFDPGEYDDIDLSKAPSPLLEEEFDDIELPGTSQQEYTTSQNLLSAKKQLEDQLLTSVTVTEEAFSAFSGTKQYGFENIVGVGISEKMTNEQFTGQPCITVYVVAKTSEDNITPEAVVPEKVGGIVTDVVATGELHILLNVGRYRPAPGGVSVGHYQITAGTLGCLVRRDRALYVLSNNHVLANINKGQIGNPILQPGPYDGGSMPADVIGRLSEFVPVLFNGQMNTVDAAIAQVSPTFVTPENKCFGRIRENPIACRRFMVAKKCGRSTELTRGIITDCNATVRVGFGTDGTALFQDQIIVMGIPFIYPFSAPGDSGSLVVEEFTNRPLGLLFAGSFTHTIVNKMSNVLSRLNVSIVS